GRLNLMGFYVRRNCYTHCNFSIPTSRSCEDIKMIRTLGTVLVCALLLSGCATMNKNECRNADWDMIGYEDASRGHAVARIGQHRKACAKVDVTPDMAAYERGHERGARVYCTRERGYREGVNGAAYQGICPADLAPTFTRAHKDGMEL